jgi:hypothetical protein
MWPAVLFFFCYRWIENIHPSASEPKFLAVLLILYSVVTFYGMYSFGREKWLTHADPFALFFGLLSHFALFEKTNQEGKMHINLRLPAVGLLIEKPIPVSGVLFIMVMLSSIAFDSLKATDFGWRFYTLVSRLIPLPIISDTIEYLLLITVFTGLYLVCITAMHFIVAKQKPIGELAGFFAVSLLPIAIAYEVAHYISLLAIEGQRIIPLVSDPLGVGWDLFNTRDYALNYTIINLKALWHWQVALIIIGHVIAVYLAHLIALRIFSTKKQAIISQYAMLVLMILYTVSSLWILAQPLTAIE